MPDLVAIGEPLVEMAAAAPGRLGEVTNFRSGWGGDTANFLFAAARLGGSGGYITRVGRDEFGAAFVTLLQQREIDTAQVKPDGDHHTGLYFVSYTEDRRHHFTYLRRDSAASNLMPEDFAPDYVRGARVLHASGISQAISPSCAEAVERAMTIACDAGTLVSYDANVRPALGPVHTLRESFERTMGLADIVFLSEEDIAHLYGETSGEAVVEAVLGQRPRLAIAKLGAAGCLVGSETGERWRVPGWEVEAVDATGAGDAFDAGFVLSLLRDESPDEAARYANAVGALTVTGVGAIAPQPSHDEVTEFLDQRSRSSPTESGTRE